MATPQEELAKIMQGLRNPGMSRTPVGTISSPGGNRDVPGPATSVGRGRAKKSAGASATGSTQANVRRPGMAAGVSSVPTANPAGRVQSALDILESPVQSSRQSTEAKLNPEIGEALRLSLIEQQRVSGPRTGSMGAFERRDRRDAQAAAQTAVDSNLSALQGIREGALTERGQTLEATGALEDRQMQEAGAFDRALLGLDESMLKGQFGLAGLAAENADPLRDLAVDVISQQVAGENATALDRRNAVNAALRLGPQAGAGPAYTFETDAAGNMIFKGGANEQQFIAGQVAAKGGPGTAAGQAFLRDYGLVLGEDGSFISTEEAKARATEKKEAAENLARTQQQIKEQEAFVERQRRQRIRERAQQNSPQTLFPDVQANPGVGAR